MAKADGRPRGRPPYKNSKAVPGEPATNRAPTRTRSLYGWTIDSAPASCAPSGGAKRTARLRPRRTSQRVAASAPNPPPPSPRRPL